jgi:hypothetical protein
MFTFGFYIKGANPFDVIILSTVLSLKSISRKVLVMFSSSIFSISLLPSYNSLSTRTFDSCLNILILLPILPKNSHTRLIVKIEL